MSLYFLKFTILKISSFEDRRFHCDSSMLRKFLQRIQRFWLFWFSAFLTKTELVDVFVQLIEFLLQRCVIRISNVSIVCVSNVSNISFIVTSFFNDIVSLCDARFDVELRWEFFDVFCLIRIMTMNLLLYNAINIKYLFILLES
jgi:hypothetical protein